MTVTAFKDGLGSVFAAHGKAFPGKEMIAAVWRRVEPLPDSFMAWAAVRLEDYEKLPSNLGRELAVVLWPQWRAEQPARPGREGCAACGGRGFWLARRKGDEGPGGRGVALCPDCSDARCWPGGRRPPGRGELERAGFTLEG